MPNPLCLPVSPPKSICVCVCVFRTTKVTHTQIGSLIDEVRVRQQRRTKTSSSFIYLWLNNQFQVTFPLLLIVQQKQLPSLTRSISREWTLLGNYASRRRQQRQHSAAVISSSSLFSTHTLFCASAQARPTEAAPLIKAADAD